jgi:galactose mutarotase-like enzyme
MPAVVTRFRGWPAVTISGGEYTTTFVPALGMLGAALTWRDRPFISLHGGLDGWRNGHTTGVPLLAPWANRLARPSYRFGRSSVDLHRLRRVHRDENGLPIHGTLLGEHRWTVEQIRDDEDGGRLEAGFDYTAPALLRAFPFPHRLQVAVEVGPDGVLIETSVSPTGRRRVPISFGWHPYFRLPQGRRAEWRLTMPPRRRFTLDELHIPIGETVRQPGETVRLRGTSFDDGFVLGSDRRFVLEDSSHQLTLRLGDGYRFAQVFAPAGKPFVALEPMTAATNALVTGDHAVVAPGETFAASFSVRVTTARARPDERLAHGHHRQP